MFSGTGISRIGMLLCNSDVSKIVVEKAINMFTHTPIVSMWFFSSNFRAYSETEGITKGIEIG